uniref:Uncharacterized protein n=1 Tax=Leersia perrieri TaxID=77586 RepID=A0A0D9W5L0_9ORYZ
MELLCKHTKHTQHQPDHVPTNASPKWNEQNGVREGKKRRDADALAFAVESLTTKMMKNLTTDDGKQSKRPAR